MPFLNFESHHFSQAEEAGIKAAMETLQTLLSGKLATLTPEERQQYGSINEQNKLMVNKVKDYRDAQPQLSSPDIDWEEFAKDYGSHSFLQSLGDLLSELHVDWTMLRSCTIGTTIRPLLQITSTPATEMMLAALVFIPSSRR